MVNTVVRGQTESAESEKSAVGGGITETVTESMSLQPKESVTVR